MAISVDVLICGGGPAGAAAAFKLAANGMRVVVLEKQRHHTWKIGETLPPAANPLLQRLGLFSDMQSAGHLHSYGILSAWGSKELVARDFINDPYGPGWQLDRQYFDAQIATAAADAGAIFHYGASLLGTVERLFGQWHTRAGFNDTECSFHSHWLIDATGRRSYLGRILGSRRLRLDDLVCVYTTIEQGNDESNVDHDTRVLVESGPEGWWYTARMPHGRRTVAWLTDADLLRGHAWRTVDWFSELVAQTCHVENILRQHKYRYNRVISCTSASTSRLHPWCGDCWMAIGDAAFAVDPLSSQGLFHALACGLSAAEALIELQRGQINSVTTYSDELNKAWKVFTRHRLAYYRLEPRWLKNAFWRRRQ